MAESVEVIYSTALFQLCEEQNCLDEVYEELSDVSDIILNTQNGEFEKFLSSPLIPADEKVGVIKNTFGGKLNSLTLDFLCVVTEKGRMNKIGEIRENFHQMYNDEKGILEVTAITVMPLNSRLSAKLKEKLENVTKKHIILTNKVDSSIMGGIVLRYGTNEIDSSVKTKLDKLKSSIDSIIA